MKFYASILIHCFLILAVSIACMGQRKNCSNLVPENSNLGYRELSNRCEGYFIPKYASNLQVACFTKGHIQYELNGSATLTVRAANEINTDFNVRAVSLLRTVHYQMDAALGPGDTLSWPVSPFLYTKELKAKDIGVYGWTGTEADKVFIPVTVRATDVQVRSEDRLRLVLISVTNLTHFRWRFLAFEDAECRIEKKITAPQNYEGHKFAGAPIIVELPRFPADIQKICMEIQYRSENKAWESVFVKLNLGE